MLYGGISWKEKLIEKKEKKRKEIHYKENKALLLYLKMNADGLEKLVGCVSREEGHKHMLENRLFKINNNHVARYTKHINIQKHVNSALTW